MSSPPNILLQKPAILVVDDEPLARMELGELVRQCGFEAWEAANTAEALSMLDHAGDHFSALITDINMPGTRNGVVLANHVRLMWPHIAIIVISAARHPMDGELPGQVSFLSKPLAPTRLMAALQSAL